MNGPRCSCPDLGVGAEVHCALLRDFPGGFYGDLEAGDYQNDDSLWCDCECHRDCTDDWDDVEDSHAQSE